MSDRHAISPYPIRMPNELRQRLDDSARQGSRSLHAEIISRLEESFTPRQAEPKGMAELTDALIALGKERGLSVEVNFSLSAEDSGEPTSQPPHVTTKIDKKALMTTGDESITYSEQAIMEAMRMALRTVAPDNAKPESNKGLKPRKR